MALRRARHGERPARLEELALVVEPLHLRGIGIAAVLLVDDDRAVVPGVPVAEHDFHEFVGAVVAQVVLQMGVLAHVERLAVVDRGDDVPGRAAVRHQVERLEAPRDVERLEIGGRGGRGEAELFGRHAHAWSARPAGPSSRSGCRIRPCGRDRCRSGRASPGGRRRTPCGICRLPGCGRSPGSSRPRWNRRATADAARSTAGWCSSAPAGNRPSPFAVSCCSPSHARPSSAGDLVLARQRAQFFPSRVLDLDAVRAALLLAQVFDLAGIEHAL